VGRYFNGEEQSLQDILTARDKRVRYQEYLIRNYNRTVISYKLNIPGPIKYSPLIRQIFEVGLSIINQKLNQAAISIVHEKVWYRNSGPEYFAVVEATALGVKELSASIEETHPLGRLFDFDVLYSDGTQVSRQELGIAPRKCLMCDNNAFECGRSRRHDVDTLTAYIRTIAFEYFRLNEEVV
jgi:holo-ACP synthase